MKSCLMLDADRPRYWVRRGGMSAGLSFDELIECTNWERVEWQGWLGQRGDPILAVSVGPHGDERFQIVGDLVKHIFSVERRYVDRLANRPATDTESLPNDNIEKLFEFGRQSRADLAEFVKTLTPEKWDVPRDLTLTEKVLKVTPRKIVVHILMHEIRHWAQISMALRLNGSPIEFQDFLSSPVLEGEGEKPLTTLICPGSFSAIGRVPYRKTTVCEVCGEECRVIQPSRRAQRAGAQPQCGMHFPKKKEDLLSRARLLASVSRAE